MTGPVRFRCGGGAACIRLRDEGKKRFCGILALGLHERIFMLWEDASWPFIFVHDTGSFLSTPKISSACARTLEIGAVSAHRSSLQHLSQNQSLCGTIPKPNDINEMSSYHILAVSIPLRSWYPKLVASLPSPLEARLRCTGLQPGAGSLRQAPPGLQVMWVGIHQAC